MNKKLLTLLMILGCMIRVSYANAGQSNTEVIQPANNFTYKDDYQAAALYQTDAGNVVGNKQGTITLVDFSDYQCIPCRQMVPAIETLAQQHPNLRIVFVDYPMLGDQSTFAAKAALAAIPQGKYVAFHNALMQSKKPLTEAQVFSLAKTVGLNINELKNEINSKNNLQAMLNSVMLGNAFGITDLPTFVVGYTQSPHHTKVYSGLDSNQLDELITQTEKAKNNSG